MHGTVVGELCGRGTDGGRFLGDAGGGAGLCADRVIGEISAPQNMAQADVLELAHVFVGKQTGALHRQVIACDFSVKDGIRGGRRGRSASVVDFVDSRDATERDGLGGNAGGGVQGTRLVQVVIAPDACAIGSGQCRDIGHGHCFVVACIFVVERARSTDSQGLAADTGCDHTRGDRGVGVAVVGLVGRGETGNRHIFWGDVGAGGRCARGAQLVVVPAACAIDWGQSAHVCHGHHFGRAHVFVCKAACCRASQAECLAVHCAVEGCARDVGIDVAVIDLVRGGEAAQTDRLGGDFGAGCGAGVLQAVIECVCAAQAQARNVHSFGDHLACAIAGHVGIGKAGGGVSNDHVVAADDVGAGGATQGGLRVGVVGFVSGCGGRRQGFGRHAHAGAGAGQGVVVAGQTTVGAAAQAQARDAVQGLVGLNILADQVGGMARTCDREGLSGHT